MTKNGIEEVQARFDRVAADWDANSGRVALAKGVVDAIRKAAPLRPEINAMDFGAGTGLVTLGLLPYVGSLTAVDASRKMLRVLDENGLDRDEVRRWLQEAGFVDTAACEAHRIIRPSPDGKAREYAVFLVTGRAG
jgi:ubiquinone/menaquinone biosynthesis C-methylase UbiE